MLRLARAALLMPYLAAWVSEWNYIGLFDDPDAFSVGFFLYWALMCGFWAGSVIRPIHRVTVILYRWLLFRFVAFMLLLGSLASWNTDELSDLSWTEVAWLFAPWAAALVELAAIAGRYYRVERARTEAGQDS